MQEKPVGLVGVGLAGSAIAERLLGAGFSVLASDLDRERAAAVARLGGEAADSAVEVAAGCRFVILSLPDAAVSQKVASEIEGALQADAIVIDTTTGDPEEIAALGARLARQGTAYLDATIGGSSEQVRAGEAILMCGGDRASFDLSRDVLSAISRKVHHAGDCGSGARMKLIFNLALGLHRAALAEALTFASACGLDAASALEILKDGPAFSAVMHTKGRKMLERDFTPQARLSQHLKDVRLILAAGARAGAFLPLSRLHGELLEKAQAAGWGDFDNSAIIQAFEDPDRKR